MKRIIYTVAIITTVLGNIYGQSPEFLQRYMPQGINEYEIINTEEYVEREDLLRDLSTHQADGEKVYVEDAAEEQVEKMNLTFIYDNPDNAPKEEYRTYVESINVKDHGVQKVVFGLTTHQMDGFREYMYWQRGDEVEAMDASIDEKVNPFELFAGDIPRAIIPDVTEEEEIYAMDEEKKAREASYKDYMITPSGEYLYTDGKPIVGSSEHKAKLENGKPITKITFFYETRDKGLISENVSLKDFMSMSVDEQIQLINGHNVQASLENLNPIDQWLKDTQLKTSFVDLNTGK